MIEIKPAEGWDDCVRCENIQNGIWKTPHGEDIVPASLLITFQNNGGLLLGAYDGHDMIGFVFGFLGFEVVGNSRHLKHCSHMLGVLPAFRGKGLGFQLKKRQRELLLAQGLDLATWTYDPLQAVNASLNIGRLGAIARRYKREAYGDMVDVLNAGVASDRFEVEWWLDSRRVRNRLGEDGDFDRESPEGIQPLYGVEFGERDLPHPTDEASISANRVSLEIPSDFASLKKQDLELAKTWRSRTRSTLESAFARKYAVFEFVRWRDERGRGRTAYVLVREDERSGNLDLTP